ncbi:DUF7507 domain-containing protein [Agromyces sp. NPDC055658]
MASWPRPVVVLITSVSLLAMVLVAPQPAFAGPGSLVGGLAWADVNRDGVRTPDEAVKPGVAVELLSSPTGPVVSTTTTGANGRYSFANVADGSYYVRATAPGPFVFPATAQGQNVFTRAGVPAVGSPERGITGPITIAGATQATNLDAGLQPLATLQTERLQIPNSCETYATTGTPPWDATDGPGLDTGPANCIVRVGDTVLQNYSVSLTGLPTGVSVPNVVIEMTINPVSNPDDPSDVADSRLQLAGPGTNGLPAGCLAAVNGANPPSSATTNANGSITVVCNLGSMSSNVGTVQLAYRFADDTPIPGFASVTASAYAGQDDAAPSNTVSGPVVQVTGTAQWEAKKFLQNGPIRATRTVNGVATPGFDHYYWIDLINVMGAIGGSDLQWPISFTDRMTKFPNAVLFSCSPRIPGNDVAVSDWSVTCPLNQAAGTTGWNMTASKPSTSRQENTRILVGVFVPTADAYRSVDPDWQPGDTPPAGTVSWENQIRDTNGWHMIGGQLNDPPGSVGPGYEPGWDGTTASGDNVVARQFNITEPRWDLSKTNTGNPSFQERDLDNNPATPAVPGFNVAYQFTVSESNGNILSSNIDRIAFKDVMPQYPGAVLTGCLGHSGNFNTGTPTCETGVQPTDGWDMSFTPNANGNNTKTNTWQAFFFVPTPTIPDPCRANVNDTISVRNEATDTDGWTAGGWLINNTGLEPGWDGTTATGNNVVTRTFNVRSTVSDCGTLRGDKQYESLAGGLTAWNQFSLGDVVNSHVWTTASTNRISLTDPTVCDVFDVSVWRVSGNPLTPVTGADPNPHLQANPTNPNFDRNDYVIEYAVGTNDVDTQTGVGNGLDNTANVTDARACRDYPGPWTTDPAATFGADWRDEVNMVRARPVNAGHVEVGPFTLGLYLPLQSRWQYNGGPNAGEDIPQGVLLNNTGAWPQIEANGSLAWRDVSRQLTANLPLSGRKSYATEAGNQWADNATVAAGTKVQSIVELGADRVLLGATTGPPNGVQAPGAPDTLGFPVDNPTVCDAFDVSVFQLDRLGWSTSSGITQSDYVIEYAVGSNAVDTQAGPASGGLYPVDRTSLVADATDCREYDGPWVTDPAQFGSDWRNKVNMVRMRPIDTDYVQHAAFALTLRTMLKARGVYNGGPDAGKPLLTGVRLSNVGGWSAGPRGDQWATMQKEVRYQGMQLIVAKSVGQATYLPGQDAIWNLSVGLNNAEVGAVMENIRLVDTVPLGLTYNSTCTRSRLPAGVTVSYNAATREVTFILGDVTATAANYWIRTGATALQLCATLETVAQPGDTYVNQVRALADNSENSPTATATTTATGSGQLGLVKNVDKALVANGETYTWSVDWANTSTVISFLPTDLIDVLPWNGDADPAAGSARGQYASDYQGLSQLTDPLAAPTYVRGGTGNVPGTWYYSTANPSTINHDPRNPANADPAAPGGLWQTAAEIADIGDVTAVRFVSSTALGTGTRVRALIPMVSTSNELDNVYVNRAEIYSGTFPNQPLLSNEPYVVMPGFTVGDLVWLDENGDGRFDDGEQGIPGVTVQVLDADGEIVSTEVTDATGRWVSEAVPAGTYTVHIPASMFAPGGPLAGTVVRTAGSSAANAVNERGDNNNTAAADPAATGLSSSPVTLSYVRDTRGFLTGANGALGDDVAGLTNPLIPDEFSNFTIDLAVMPEPEVDIEKSTNGQDADQPTGPNVAVGGVVRWTYVVTNTGGVDLADVTVTDDRVDAAAIDCGGTGSNIVVGPLAPGGSFTCVAEGTATEGQYENLGSVTALDPTSTPVADDDPSHYFGATPAVDIEKSTNGEDADEPTGPLVTVGGEVRWTYVVMNTGNVPLTDVTVVDDQVDAADIDCDGTGSNVVPGPLGPDETFTCVASGEASPGQYANLGTVTGTGPETTDVDGNAVAGPTVTDEDPSHYFGVEPAVDIEKATNGQDADEVTGPVVAAGGEVRWTYVVTNTGNVPLTDVTVVDDQVDAADIDCDGMGGNVVAGPLAPGASFTCVATGEATPGQYENLGTVTGIGPETTDVDGETVAGEEVTDEDPSHYFGVAPAVDIEKATNGQDADEATGPNVTVGGGVRWTYVVTNTGNVPLTDVTVTDDLVDASGIDCDGTGSNIIAGPVAPGDTFTCVANGTATAGQYENLGTVTGIGPETTDVDGEPVAGETVTDDDPSHYFGVEPAIDIEKATNGQDADEPTGPIVNRFGEVRWTYVVTNTGNVVLTDVTVTDDLVDADDITCEGGDGNVVAELEPGESVECTATGTAIVGQYANLGSVTGIGPATTDVDGETVAGETVTDDDPSHYFGVEPAVDIEKATNGQDADESPGPLVAAGGDVRWTYVVTNTGTSDLTDVTVTDDQVDAADIDCDGTGGNVVAGPLAPGASFTCVATGEATPGQYENLGTVTGIGPETTDVDGETVAGEEVTDEDPSHYFGVAPAVDIEKATNGEDADEPTGPSITVGGDVEWTYVVTNTGNVPLTDVAVTDDRVDASGIDCDGTGSNVVAGPLEPGASFTCVATGTAVIGQYANLGTVVGTGPETTDVDGGPVAGAVVTDEDWSHYLGTVTSTPRPGDPPTGNPPSGENPPPATSDDDPLASTGFAIGVPIALGAVLLGGGLLFVLIARRRRSSSR